MLEHVGWKVAWIGPLEGAELTVAGSGVVQCPRSMVLAALATGVEMGESADGETIATQQLQAAWGVCLAWTWYETESAWSVWACD